MSHWLCLLRGHQRTPIVFATNRFYCRRCGIDLEPDPAPKPEPPAVSVAPPRIMASRPLTRKPAAAESAPPGRRSGRAQPAASGLHRVRDAKR